jgi:hypothetical protein
MTKERFTRSVQIVLVLVVFGIGFLCGSITQKNAQAQLKELGQAGVQQMGQSGGKAGSVLELGKSIVEMQQHVDGLQKNLNTLKGIKSALGG